MEITKLLESNPSRFFAKIIKSRDIAHEFHLKAVNNSYATHKALQSYYETIVDLFDGLIESYQGKYGIVSISNLKNDSIENNNPIQYFESLVKEIKAGRNIFKESYIQNQIDTILELCYSTLYKLKNFN